MGTPRFTPEFKEEAVRQITERGYSIAEVSERLGVSAHSLYKWRRAVKPDNSGIHGYKVPRGTRGRPSLIAPIFDYIEVFYNRTRRHSHPGGVSPDAFEKAAP